MIKTALWLAILTCSASAASGIKLRPRFNVGSPTPWALLASVALCLTMDAAGVEFSLPVWVLIDVLVACVIIRPTMTIADTIIVALFIPAWAFYLGPEETRYSGVAVVVIVQLFLTFPAALAWRGVRWALGFKPGNDFDRMVAHA